jgi:hypothetical protein|tara:strand:+ start:4748 stop:5065 length:318 start_codon:yes stop_codon:yes gene_type:complete
MITLKNNKLMLYFDVLKDDIMDNIFEKCYEPLYLEILELETKIELLKLKINENYDLNDYLNHDWLDDDTRGWPYVFMDDDRDEAYEFNKNLLISKIEQNLLYKIN